MTVTDVDELYRFATLQQIHNSTGAGYSTLRAAVRTGRLPAFRMRGGRRLYVRVADAQALFQPVVQPSEKD